MSEEVALWYDRAYGGPLKLTEEDGAPDSWHVHHGPWSAHVVIPLPATHTAGLAEQLSWEHDRIGAVAPSVMPPREMPDTLLMAARLARGLTLLTQGTAYDITTQQYLNPSDWQDRSLNAFAVNDHVIVAQDDQVKPGVVWCYTLGLSKFGYDELETFLPQGMPDQVTKTLLIESAQEIIRTGQTPKVGASFDLPLLCQRVTISNHRTVAPGGRMLGFREVQIS